MTQALVPYDRTFPSRADREAYGALWSRRLIGEMVASVSRAMVQFGRAMNDALGQMTAAMRSLEVNGLLPPDPTDLLHGKRWRSPMTGQQYRVAGRRGNRHWIESGPRGWRRP